MCTLCTVSNSMRESLEQTPERKPHGGQTRVRVWKGHSKMNATPSLIHVLKFLPYIYYQIYSSPTALGSSSLILEEIQSQDVEAFSLRSLIWEVAEQGLKSR